MSFNEGNITNTLEVVSKKKIEHIENSQNLVNSLADVTVNKYTYRLIFNDKNSLKKFKDKLDNDQNIEKINVVLN